MALLGTTCLLISRRNSMNILIKVKFLRIEYKLELSFPIMSLDNSFYKEIKLFSKAVKYSEYIISNLVWL